MNDVTELTRHLTGQSPEDIGLIGKAYDFADKAHAGQTRNSGEPYINHCFATACNIAELGMGAATIAAGLLHDTIEDTSVTAEDIKREFGPEILFIVEGVTKSPQTVHRNV
jgi:GTP pyrophosphokinase